MIEIIDERVNLRLQGIYTACTAVVTQLLENGSYANVKLEDIDETELFKVPVAPYLKYLHYHEPATVVVKDTDNGATVATYTVAGPAIDISLQEGDRVLVIFSKYPFEKNCKRRFSINDAVIVAKL
ncbi:hypothetical protein DRP05_10625 [Archaeoglobales archaeon]|nr:MAG: hypothetical protein DRO97_06335 [Archaeoglobales archaeon]RLI77302.1 MAG: hypothetical protein DRP05_10625 [Archaeoglobales archaeon]